MGLLFPRCSTILAQTQRWPWNPRVCPAAYSMPLIDAIIPRQTTAPELPLVSSSSPSSPQSPCVHFAMGQYVVLQEILSLVASPRYTLNIRPATSSTSNLSASPDSKPPPCSAPPYGSRPSTTPRRACPTARARPAGSGACRAPTSASPAAGRCPPAPPATGSPGWRPAAPRRRPESSPSRRPGAGRRTPAGRGRGGRGRPC
ncbi:hypothetical protein V8C44DRAFT_332878, partial [Trichoderma aethiopicum]